MIKSLILIICVLLSNNCFTRDPIRKNESKIYNQVTNENGYNGDVSVTIKFVEDDLSFVDKKYNTKKERRQKKSQFITESNRKKMDELKLEKYRFSYSEFAPFAFATYSYDEYCKHYESICNFSMSNQIDKIYFEKKSEAQEEGAYYNTSASSTKITINQAKEIINADETNYTGDGIIIGVLEANIPYPEITETNSYGGCIDGATPGNHANLVASIIGTSTGIAKDVVMYFGHLTTDATSTNWLISKNVDIINISSNLGAGDGCYSATSAYFDYISKEHDIIVVKSAGNNQNNFFEISQPGTGLNVITVGSVDYAKNISFDSSYVLDSSIKQYKNGPNLVAPGEKIVLEDYCDRGTSFAAPMVTGVVALLLEEFPQYKEHPEVIISALMNGANTLPGQSDLVDERGGAGLLNYTATRNLLLNGNVNLFSINESTQVNTIVGVTFLNIPAYQTADISLCRMFNSTTNDYDNSINLIPIVADTYQLDVYDNSTNQLLNSYQIYGNTAMIKISNTYPSQKNYQLKLKLITNTNENNNYTWSLIPQIHSYNASYEKYNSTLHKCICSCNDYILGEHVWATGALGIDLNNDIQYVPNYVCTVCGYSTTIPPGLLL